MAFLRDYGVTMVVDLRGDSELASMPDLLREADWAEYVHLPMFEANAARGAGVGKKHSEAGFNWGDIYVAMCEDFKGWVQKVMEALGRCEGTALFHCTTGKDRTGIVAALLLGLCGVAEEDIVADYCVSQLYLDWIYEKMPVSRKSEDEDPFFGTAPSNMQKLLKHLREKYGGIVDYLRDCGVSDELIAKLRERLVIKN